MFIILKPVDAPKGFRISKKLKKTINKNPAKYIKTSDGMPFAVLEIFRENNEIEWEKVAAKCGRYTSRVIAPNDLFLPENQRISPFIPSYFPSELCLNTALEILDTVKLPPDSFTLSLCDYDCRFIDKLRLLIPFCSSIKVITGRIEKYIPICTEILEKTGASVMLRSSFEKSGKRDAIIFCSGPKSELISADIVFSCDKSVRGKTTVIGSDVVLLEEHKEVIGKDIDSVTFASALAELCSSHMYENSVCERIDIVRRGGDSTFSDLISTLADNG